MRGATRNGERYGYVQYDAVKEIDWFVDAFCRKDVYKRQDFPLCLSLRAHSAHVGQLAHHRNSLLCARATAQPGQGERQFRCV